jgi:hypothetical protein
MFVAHITSSYLSRQMEFDADRHAVHLVGLDAFTGALRELPTICTAERGALVDLDRAVHSGRLADDLPALIAANLRQLPEAIRQQVREAGLHENASMYASHPTTTERIVVMQAEAIEPRFTGEGPATRLFRDFAAVARTATEAVYADEFLTGPRKVKLVATAVIVGEVEAEEAARTAYTRVFGLLPPRGLCLAAVGTRSVTGGDPAVRAMATRPEIHAYDPAPLAELGRHAARCNELRAAGWYCAAGIAIDAASFELHESSSAAADAALAEAEAAHTSALGLVSTASAPALARIDAAGDALRGEPVHHAEHTRLLACLCALGESDARVDEIASNFAALDNLWEQMEQMRETPGFVDMLRKRLADQHVRLRGLQQALAGAAYPFEHGSGATTLAAYALGELPHPEAEGPVMESTQQCLRRIGLVRERVVLRLAALVELAERTLELAPDELPATPDTT